MTGSEEEWVSFLFAIVDIVALPAKFSLLSRKVIFACNASSSDENKVDLSIIASRTLLPLHHSDRIPKLLVKAKQNVGSPNLAPSRRWSLVSRGTLQSSPNCPPPVPLPMIPHKLVSPVRRKIYL